MKSPYSRASGARRGSLLGLLAFALMILTPAFAVDPVITNNPLEDLWVANPNLKGTTGNLLLGGSAGKEIFLRFHVDESAGTGTPMSAQLKLYQNGGFTSPETIRIYAANNRSPGATTDWTEASLTWGNQPVYADQLDTSPSRTAAGDVVFDLTDYISGPGDYSFRIAITGSTAEHSFGHKGLAVSQRPRLEFQVEGDNAPGETFLDPNSPYYERIPSSDLIPLGGIYGLRYKLSNPGSGGGDDDVDNIGYINVTKQPYGAKPNDAGYDSTWAIQRAVNEARDARLAVYFPPGTYYVSRTIQMAQGATPLPHQFINNLRWSAREFPCVLLGDRAGTRSKIKIMAGSPFFDNAVNPQPVLRFWSRLGTSDPTNIRDPEINLPGYQYYQCLDNIDLDLSAKAQAVGIDLDGAQGANLTNIKITATGAHAGILGGTGPGGYTYGVEVVGGQFGGYFKAAHCPLIFNSKFKDQTSHALYHEGRGPLTLVGVQIESTVTQTGARVKLNATNPNPWQAAFNAVDCSIQGTGLLIETNRSVSLTNTYLKNGSGTAIQQTDPEDNAVNNFSLGSASWRIVSEYARGVLIDQQLFPTPLPGETPNDTLRVQYWINGTASTSGTAHYVNGGTTSAPPAYMTFGDPAHRHQLPASPQFTATDNSTVINAKTTTLGGGGAITAAKLTALALVAEGTSQAIFIPAGEYLLNDTVTFKWNTKLFGVSPALSTLRADKNPLALIANKPMITSGTSAAAINLLADLKLLLPMDCQGTTSMALWKAGAGSTVKNVGFDDRDVVDEVARTVPLIKITGNGGGKWAGLWILEGKNASGANGHMLEVNGTSQALKFYFLDLEHNNSSPQAKFINAANFDIYQVKAESQLTSVTNLENELYWFEGCQNFRAFGFGGSARPDTPDPDVEPPGHTLIRLQPYLGTNNNHYMFTQLQFQQPTNGGTGTEPNPNVYSRLMDNGVVKVRGDRQAVLYKRGTPPNN